MKTKSLMLAALVVLGSLTALANNDPNNKGLFVINAKPGVYKLIYEGEKSASVTLTIFNEKGRVVYNEIVRGVKGFILPVNFKGMNAGEYTIQIKNGYESFQTVVSYAPEMINPQVYSKTLDVDKFAIVIAGQGEQTYSVKIYDSNWKLIDTYSEKVVGNFGKVFNLSKIHSSAYTFEVSNANGVIKTVKF
ncbi:MAG: hypothetical protein KF687_07330 [Cyclobacteriaceae bacterium]|nr:hypothetical protein [Cyclobacteriaceae bacterium]